MPTEIDYARLAAYIDGEGQIRIDLQRGSAGNKFYERHLLELKVTNTNPLLAQWCKQTFGGAVKPRGKPRKPQHKPELDWYVGGGLGESLLRSCLPYFILKRPHAEVALAFRELLGRRGKKVSPEVFAKRESLRQQLKVLNKRGIDIQEAVIQ